MKKKRINDTVLASIPVQNGQILKGEHLAILREVLSASINENKYDIDRIVAGQDAVHVYGDDVDALDAYASENTVANETLGYLYTENQIILYKYITGEWQELGVLNLTELFNKVRELDARTVDGTSDGILVNGTAEFKGVSIFNDVHINGTIGSDADLLTFDVSIMDFNDAKVTNLGTPTDATDATTKEYVDSLIGSGGGGGEVDLSSMPYFNYASSIYGAKYSLLVNAWEHSLTVDPLEIMANSDVLEQKGTAQYPNGATEGIIIPEGVTSIGEDAFRSFPSYNQPLVIPNSVTSIGKGAFRSWDTHNQPLVIPNSVTSIGKDAFNFWLENNHPIVIPASVTSIGDGAFRSWSSVPYVEMKSTTPPSLAHSDAFYGQNNTPIYVPDASVTAYKTAINWVTLADRIFPISDRDNTYSKVEIDNKDTVIMNKANDLENANMFKDVNYNNINGVLTFTRYDDTSKTIDLPLELLVDSGYYDEVSNELVLVLANGSEIKIPVGDLLTDLDAHNIRFNGSGTNYLTAKTEVESALKELDKVVEERTFNKELLTFTLPNHVTDYIKFENGKYYYVQRVKKYTLQESDIVFLHTGSNILDYATILKPYDYIGNGIASSDDAIMSNGVTSAIAVGGDEYNPSNIGKLITDRQLTEWQLGVPDGTYVSLAHARDNLAGTDIYYQLTTPIETEIDDIVTANWIYNLKAGAEVNTVDLNVMAYFNYAGNIYGAKYSLLVSAWEHSLTVAPLEISAISTSENIRGLAQYPNAETEGIIIPHGVTSIGEYAFHTPWTPNNQPLVIPDSVTSIGDKAFRTWTLNNHPLVIPDSVTSIGPNAFREWSSNNQPLVIPSSVTSMGDSAFEGWTSNNQPLTIQNGVTTIGGSMFHNWTSNNQPLVIPDSVTSIGEMAFYNWLSVPYIEMKSTTPPTLSAPNAFGYQNDAPIYVPDESVEAYKTATQWAAPSLAVRIFSINDKKIE